MNNVYDQKFQIYEGINQKIVQFVPPGSYVLDLGCNTGRLGAYLKKTKACTVFGIDISQSAIEQAKKRLDGVLACDIEQQSVPEEWGQFDVIIFGDMLEHLKYPEIVLQQVKSQLKPHGRIITSIPNVANISIRLKLLFGRWNYREKGILDATHLRFFTYKTMLDLFSKVGLGVIAKDKIPGVYFFVAQKYRWTTFVHHILSSMMPKLFTAQFIFCLESLE